MDPQLTGWPLTAAEREWVAKAEYSRKPGHEAQKHLPEMWFVTPTAAHWAPKDGSEGNDWIVHHGECLKRMRSERGAAEIVLLGDSLTQGWGGGWDGAAWNAAWERHFEGRRAVNLGIGGDRIEQILWRLDHGALDGVTGLLERSEMQLRQVLPSCESSSLLERLMFLGGSLEKLQLELLS